MNTILTIGADSNIAKKFIEKYSDVFLTINISRNKIGYEKELVIEDLFTLQPELFYNVDIVLNFAGLVHHPEIKNPDLYDSINYKLTLINAQKAKHGGVKLFIQMSSIAVYGNADTIDINTPYNPINPYGRSKLKADEELLKLQDDNFKVAIIRPPMVYGGGNAPGNMLRLIRLIDKRIPLPFKGINNKRDFINIHNLVQYLSIIAEKQFNGIFIVSDKEPISTESLIKIINQNLGTKNFIIRIPSLALRFLKWIRPNEYNKLFGTLHLETNFPFEDLIQRYTIEQGIREMVEWYRKQ